MGNLNFRMMIIFVSGLKEMWEGMLMISCNGIYLLETNAC